MRIGIGGGNRILRGGVSAGRGGVRGGVGVGPFHVSGGGSSRGSVSSDMEDILVLAAPYIGKFMLVGAIVVAIFLAVLGPLIYLLFLASIVALFIFLYNGYTILRTISNPFRDQTRILENIAASLTGHVISVIVMFGLVWLNSRAEESALEKTATPQSFMEEPGYWGWWKRQGETLIGWVYSLDIYLVLPATLVLLVLIVHRRRNQGDFDVPREKLNSLSHRMKLVNSLQNLTASKLNLAKLTKAEKNQLMSLSVNLLSELESFWRDQLNLRQHEDVTEKLARRYIDFFDGVQKQFLDNEFSDAVILSSVENSKNYSDLRHLTKARQNYLASVMENNDSSHIAKKIYKDLTKNSIGGMRR